MWVKEDDQCWQAWDDWTYLYDGCVIVREPVKVWASLSRPVSHSLHECPRHRGSNAIYVRWPEYKTQINKPDGPQVTIGGTFDRNETLGELP